MVSEVLVTGATGFIGRHVVRELRSRGCRTTALGVEAPAQVSLAGAEYVQIDFTKATPVDMEGLGSPDVVIHLAWKGLPNYESLHHIEENYPASYRFIKSMVQAGVPKIVCAGTCFEYGIQSGRLCENALPRPSNAYSVAKDMLRRSLELLKGDWRYDLTWVRLFYLYGPGQNPNALIPQLDHAIESGAKSFEMSGGEQLRDYLPVEQAAAYLADLALHQGDDGIVNCCSGRPISIRRLVEEHVKRRGSRIALDMGKIPYSPQEPMAFWGSNDKLLSIINEEPAE